MCNYFFANRDKFLTTTVIITANTVTEALRLLEDWMKKAKLQDEVFELIKIANVSAGVVASFTNR